jgi:mannose-1-phosphate guanylyltransferase/mannose-6-phosphate isomerase
MLQDTVTRLQGLPASVDVLAPIVVCNAEHRFIAASQLAAVRMEARILLEPCGRNTAPALTLAALQICEDGADPILLAMPADNVVADRPAMHAAVIQAVAAAEAGAMVTFGIVADRPETGYGYIQRGAAQGDGTYRIASFAEKPDADTARSYLESGDYLWNSGLFIVRASIWLKAISALRHDILDACTAAMQRAVRDLDFVRPNIAAFTACPSDSIDYAVMERLPTLPEVGIPSCVVPMQAGWSDLGAWDALWDALDHDENNNATVGDTILHGSADSLLLATNRLVAGVGLNNIVVVETPDAVLVADRAQTQAVKHVVTRLKARGNALAHNHRKVHRPWGWYDSIDMGKRFQVKRIVVSPGATLSLQMHHHRAEHWIVVSGTAEVTNGEKVFLLSENESTFIPLGRVHRLANPGKMPLEMIEVQSGSYLGEDDIVRFEDSYGRTRVSSDVPARLERK